MLVVGPKLDRIEAGAGEPFIVSIVFRDANGDPLDMTDRRVVMSFFKTSGRGLFAAIDGVPAGPGVLEFVRPGTFTASLYGQGLTVSLSERLLLGRETLATGTVKIAATADPVESFGALIGRAEVRLTVHLDDLGAVLRWGESVRRPYANDGAPVIITPAGISSDGTPQVGETLTGIDPVGNGPIVARRWIVGASTVAMVQTYAPTTAGSLRYEADLQGPDGTIATSGSTITVAGGVTLAAITGSGALTSGSPSSGTITGKTTGSTLSTTVPGLTITGSSYSFDGTGAAGSYGITETLAGATNSPNTTQVVVLAAGSSGGVSWTGVSWTGVSWGGGTTPTTITLSVGSVTSAAEGNPGTGGITLSVGSITTQPEGNPASGITLSVGSITAQPEGN